MVHLSRSRRFLAIAAGLGATAQHAAALEASDVLVFSKGPVQLRPQLSLSGQFSDNILYRSADRFSDFISIISPGVNVRLGHQELNHLFFKYTFDQHLYAEHDELDAQQHRLGLDGAWKGSRAELQGSDTVEFLSSPLGGGERVIGLASQNVDRTLQNHNYTLSYSVTPRTRVYVEGNYNEYNYASGIGLYDQSSWTGTGGFGYQAFTRIFLFGEGFYGRTDVSPNHPALPAAPHSFLTGGFIGARGDFTPKITGSIKVGYETRSFSDGTPEHGAPAVDVSASYRLSEKTAFSLTYSRRSRVSVQFASQSYVSDFITAGVTQVLGGTGKWIAALGITYQLSDYEQRVSTASTRSDHWYRAYGQLSYDIQPWLRASLGYEHEALSSNLNLPNNRFDYDVNRVTLRLAVGY